MDNIDVSETNASEEEASHATNAKILAAAGAAVVASAAMTNDAAAVTLKRKILPPDATNFGQCPEDQALHDAYQVFLKRLEDAGKKVFKAYNPPTSLSRADGFRYLLQGLGQAFTMGFEVKNPKYPSIYTFSSPWFKLGGDNADCVYQLAWIDGESTYRISGNRGSVKYFNIAVQGPRPAPTAEWRPLTEPFGDAVETAIFGQQLECDWNGNFELFIGGPKRGPNWLPTTAGSRKLFIRQYFDSFAELPARIRIERVDMDTPRPVPTAKDIEKALDWMGDFVRQNMIDFPDWGYEYVRDVDPDPVMVNKFVIDANRAKSDEPANNEAKDKLRARSGVAMHWKMAPDEAMIVEWDRNDIFWMLTNMGLFMNSMDYLYRPISWTPSRTKVDTDGKVRFVMAHDDPGYHNWIDCEGITEGFLENRNVFTTAVTDIRTKLVKRSELASAMPADSLKVTLEERAKMMWERFHAMQKRFML